MRKIAVIELLSIILFANAVLALNAAELNALASSGKTVFVLVTDPTANQVERAQAAIGEARKQIANSELAVLDRTAPDSTELVAKYRLSGAPVPLILVIASNGLAVGGVTADKATPDVLVKMVPSPKKLEVLSAIQEGKAVFIVAQKKGMNSLQSIDNSCVKACQQMNDKSTTVKIDMDDKAETDFLALLKVDVNAAEPVTIVANAQGQITNKFNSVMNVDELVQAAAKKVGGCCPSTVSSGSKGCPPPK